MKLDEEIYHPSHPKHKLKIKGTHRSFTCNGCREPGIGLKYSCDKCNFNLHDTCALPTRTFVHPFYEKCKFQFHDKAPGKVERKCDACDKDIRAFVYHYKPKGLDLHPGCANLLHNIDDGKRNFHLHRELSRPCNLCGRTGPGWSYRSECKKYNYHVSCVNKMSEKASYFKVDKNQARVDKNQVNAIQTTIPSKGALENHRKGGGGKVRTWSKIFRVIRIIVWAILGDPTVLMAEVVAGFISK